MELSKLRFLVFVIDKKLVFIILAKRNSSYIYYMYFSLKIIDLLHSYKLFDITTIKVKRNLHFVKKPLY